MRKLDYYAKMLGLGRISRREFMGHAAAAGATVAMSSTLASKALKAAMAKKGGHLRIGIGHGAASQSDPVRTASEAHPAPEARAGQPASSRRAGRPPTTR